MPPADWLFGYRVTVAYHKNVQGFPQQAEPDGAAIVADHQRRGESTKKTMEKSAEKQVMKLMCGGVCSGIVAAPPHVGAILLDRVMTVNRCVSLQTHGSSDRPMVVQL